MTSVLTSPSQSRELCSRVFNLLTQQLRYRNRPNLKRPLPAHFNRVRMLTVCEPVYPSKPKNCQKDAMVAKKKDNPVEDNPYAVFLAGKMRRDLASHPLTCIFHFNSYTQHELIKIRGTLFDMNFDMRIQERVNRNVAKMALTGTKWSPLIHLSQSNVAFGYCAEENIPKLMKALKKMPQFLLIAAIVQGRILHKDAILELEKLRDITNVRAQLCSTLGLQSVMLSQNLTANINALSQSLGTYARPDDTSSSSSSSDSDSDSDSSSSDSDKESR